MSRKNLVICFSFTAITIVASVVIVRTTIAQNGPRVPFTAHVVDTYYKYPSGEFVNERVTTFAAKSDGSNVKIREQVAPDGRKYEVKGVIDVPAKIGKTTDSLTRSVVTVPYNDQFLGQFTTKPTGCAADTPEVSSEILGYKVLKSSTESPSHPQGEVRRVERWVALTLDCFPLKETLYYAKDGGAMLPVTQTEVRSLIPGEPDPSLFQQPADFTEKTPSQVLGERQRISGSPDCPECAKRDAALDGAYQAQRQSAGKK